MSKIIAIFTGEGFKSTATQLEDFSITFTADADIDADGANGQCGGRPAYMVGNKGTEHLANGGMTMDGNKVVGLKEWFKNIAILDASGQPKEFPGGVIASKTAYRWLGINPQLPEAYVDSETINYIAIPPEIRSMSKGVVMGCRVKCFNRKTGKTAWGMVADIGPRKKVGEVSIAMARALGMNESPRVGGESSPVIEYTIYPNCFAEINGEQVPLISAKDRYVLPTDNVA